MAIHADVIGDNESRRESVANCSDESVYAARRERMVRNFSTNLVQPISDPRVLEAMRTVPRHCFVPSAEQGNAYRDHPLPIGHGQTISQPSLIAMMCDALQLRPTDRVLEIGAGSGYHAAVLSLLAKAVYTVERLEPLAVSAIEILQQLGYTNVHVCIGDGYSGWPEAAPYDAILVACSPHSIPPALVEQVRDGGRIVIPVGTTWEQDLHCMQKRDGQLVDHRLFPVRFVPMVKG